MIKTYLKHFIFDRFLNSIFDGLLNTFTTTKHFAINVGDVLKTINYIDYEDRSFIIQNVTVTSICADVLTFEYSGKCNWYKNYTDINELINHWNIYTGNQPSILHTESCDSWFTTYMRLENSITAITDYYITANARIDLNSILWITKE